MFIKKFMGEFIYTYTDIHKYTPMRNMFLIIPLKVKELKILKRKQFNSNN